MKNIKTYEGWRSFFSNNEVEEEEVVDTTESDETERKELIAKTERSISLAQRNGSPTYYDHVRKSTEVTPNISNRKQSLRNMRRDLK